MYQSTMNDSIEFLLILNDFKTLKFERNKLINLIVTQNKKKNESLDTMFAAVCSQLFAFKDDKRVLCIDINYLKTLFDLLKNWDSNTYDDQILFSELTDRQLRANNILLFNTAVNREKFKEFKTFWECYVLKILIIESWQVFKIFYSHTVI